MKYEIGQRWAVRRLNTIQDFDFVIIAPGSKPDRKLCRVEYVTPNETNRVNFEQEYTHAHIKKCAILILPHMTPQDVIKAAIQDAKDEAAFGLLMEIVQMARSEKDYEKFLPDLKKALQESPAAADMLDVMIRNLEG